MKTLKLDLQNKICYTGDAHGSDETFTKYAVEAGHKVVIVSFEGQTIVSKEGDVQYKILNKEELDKGDKNVKKANIYLKRNLSKLVDYKLNLLRRNYYQIKDATRLYVAGYFKTEKKEDLYQVNVDGGTAWAVQMFAIKFTGHKMIPLYFYCCSDDCRYQCKIKTNIKLWFECVKIVKVPKPKGLYAGIGTRDITENAKEAIKKLFIDYLLSFQLILQLRQSYQHNSSPFQTFL